MDTKRLDELSRTAAERIACAIAENDWTAAETLAIGLGGDYSNRGMTLMLTSFLAALQPRYDAANETYAARIREAIAARDKAAIGSMLDDKRQHHKLFHELYVDFMARLMSAFATHFGRDDLEELLREVGEDARAPLFEPVWKTGPEGQVEAYAAALRGHMGRFTVSEDEDKYSFYQELCGSGGRLMREGRYEGEDALVRVSGGPMTLGRQGFPVYCTHCPVWLGQQHQEWFGSPQWVLDPPATDTHPCRLHIYKDGTRIPQTYRDAITHGARDERRSDRTLPAIGDETDPSHE